MGETRKHAERKYPPPDEEITLPFRIVCGRLTAENVPPERREETRWSWQDGRRFEAESKRGK